MGADMNILAKAFAFALLAGAGAHLNAADATSFPTRYGTLAFNGAGVLAFKGRPVSPEVSYEKFAMETPMARFSLGASDVFLFHQPQGNSCPGNFVYVSVGPGGATATKPFGTCFDDNTQPVQSGDSITFSMPGMGGKGKSVFVYKAGVVTENGARIR
jgi:hypothetical protein